ncbi:MAG TPA: amidohydrolase family protein [Candidatus Dormibacteraeota bacterium]|jgi:predicted TIM-barrel fold metal-dependent hydrolase
MPTKVIDCDVHPFTTRGLRDALEYLDEGWRRRIERFSGLPGFRLDSWVGGYNRDAIPPDGGKPASDPAQVQRELLDPHHVEHAVLIPLEHAYAARLLYPDETAVLSRAFNDYFIERWLPADPRFVLAIGVSPRDPAQAAAEIRRVGATPGVACVYLPLANVLMGDRSHWPIYEAAVEMDLPINSHVGSGEGEFQGSPTFAGGIPPHYNQWHALFPQIAMSNLVSLVLEGTFERFPGLRVVFTEWGFSWLPHVLWRMDKEWRGLRAATPWVRRPPSEYVREHVRLTTQPMDEPERDEMLQMLRLCHAGETLLFSSDYPHWDNDFPERTFAGVPEPLRTRILHDSAAEFFPRLRSRPRQAAAP